jgi:large conductance mechanosensitive channel
MKKIKKIAKDFKNFATKGDILAMATGIMIGTAFKDLIDSLVKDIISPPIGFLTSGLNFSDLFFTIGITQYETIEKATDAGAIIITYGNFINILISFLITTVVLFIVINQTQKFFVKEEKKKKRTVKQCPYCFSKIDIKATRCSNCTSKL